MPERTARAAGTTSRGRVWPMIVVGLLVTQVGLCAVAVYLANADGSFAVEPDYYEKALRWNEVADQARANERLGWRTETAIVRAEPASEPELRVRLRNADDAALDGAAVEAEIFHHASSGTRFTLDLAPRGDGLYAAPVPEPRHGLWEVRLTVKRGPERFTRTDEVELAAVTP